MTEEQLVLTLYNVILTIIPFLINLIGWAASSVPKEMIPWDQIPLINL